MYKDSRVAVEYNGIGFFGLLTLLFIGLKLTGYIDWSWLWVLSPLWIPVVIMLLFIVLVAAIVSSHKVFKHMIVGMFQFFTWIYEKIRKGSDK